MKISIKTLVIFATFLISTMGISQTYEVQAATGTNIASSILDSAQLYLQTKILHLNEHPHNKEKQQVALKVIRFTEKATVYISVTNKENKVVWRDEAEIAHPDDLQKVLTILAESIVTRKKTQARNSIKSVTGAESESYTKRRANKNIEVYIAGHQIIPSGEPKAAFIPSLGIAWTYDMRDLIIGLKYNYGRSNDENHISQGEIFALYPLSDSRNTFYIGGGIEHLYLSLNELDSASGLALNCNFGYLVGRSDSVHLRLNAGLSRPFFKLGESSVLMPQFSIGVGF